MCVTIVITNIIFNFQIVASINFMLSDVYISIYNNPSTTVVVDSTDVNNDSATCFEEYVISSIQLDHGTYSVDIQNLCISYKNENVSLSEYFLFFILLFFIFIFIFEDNSCFTVQ